MATIQDAQSRMEKWLDRFRYYRDPPNAAAVHAWISHFEEPHQELARKVLDEVIVVSERQIQEGYKAALAALPGWLQQAAPDSGRWFFVGFGKAGESGPAMVRIFREANDLALEKFDSLFCSLSDLPQMKLTAYDTVVFIDDFSGTGRQVCKLWPVVAELVASEATCHLILTAATGIAVQAISEMTDLKLHASIVLSEKYNVFSGLCETFSEDEKQILLHYGQIASGRWPCGYGNSGLLLVISHKTPNNSLPILHVNEVHWKGLFPRYLKAVLN
jgi:hypothetical protein